MVAGELVFAVGHEGHLMRPQVAHEAHQVVERVSLDVVLGLRPVLQQRGDLVHVVGTDVALVGPRMHGDARRPGLQAQRSGPGHAGYAQVARVAHQRDLVEVDG